MIAVTVVTPSYKHLEKEAVRRFKKHSGLPVKVIRAKDSDGFVTKLELDRHCGKQRVVFFDVDWYMQKPIDFTTWSPNHWFAVQDFGVYNPSIFPRQDCDLLQMDHRRYFNSGFMVINFAIESHRKVFQKARTYMRQLKNEKLCINGQKIASIHDKTDQSILNLACQHVNVDIIILPQSFNYYHKGWEFGQNDVIPRNIIGLHAAGFPIKEKARALRDQERVLCRVQKPMCPDAIRMRYSQLFET